MNWKHIAETNREYVAYTLSDSLEKVDRIDRELVIEGDTLRDIINNSPQLNSEYTKSDGVSGSFVCKSLSWEALPASFVCWLFAKRTKKWKVTATYERQVEKAE